MRLMRALIFAGAITSVSSILNYSRVDAQTSSTASGPASKAAPAAAGTQNKNFDLTTISKEIIDEGSRLKNDAAEWDQKMQVLELDLNKSQQDDEATAKDVDEGLVVLRAAAGRTRTRWRSQGHISQTGGCPSRARELGGGAFTS